MNIAEGIRFDVTTPKALAKDRWPEIQALRQRYYESVFKRRTPDQVAVFVGHATRSSWADLNTSGLQGTFKHARVGVAYNNHDEVAAFSYLVTNVSSERNGLLGAAERIAKLHVGRLAAKRYAKVFEIVGQADLQVATTHVAFGEFSSDQVVSAHPYSEEKAFIAQLSSWGNAPAQDESGRPYPAGTVFAFGEQAEPAQQLWYTGARVSDVSFLLRQQDPKLVGLASQQVRGH
ncbi:MAG: hypothetical protein ABI221_00955 [Candidatus Saccharimonadales bacterium]